MEEKKVNKYNFWKEKVAPILNPLIEDYEIGIFENKMTSDGTVPFWKDERWTRFQKRNYDTGHIFTGGNKVMSFFYEDETFITKKAMEKYKATLKPDAEPIKLLRPIFPYTKDENDKKIQRPIFFKLYDVYGTSSVDNLPDKKWEEDVLNTKDSNAEDFITRMKSKVLIKESDRILIEKDSIHFPKIERFQSSETYYLEFFKTISLWAMLKSKLSKEEDLSDTFNVPHLVSEIVSATICRLFSIDVLPDSTSYVTQWLSTMKSDISILTSSSSKSEKVLKFLFQ